MTQFHTSGVRLRICLPSKFPGHVEDADQGTTFRVIFLTVSSENVLILEFENDIFVFFAKVLMVFFLFICKSSLYIENISSLPNTL